MICWYQLDMKKSIAGTNKDQKKSRGRQPTPRGSVAGTSIHVRLSTDELALLDAWITEQKERYGVEFSRPDAIRARLNASAESGVATPRRQAKPGSK
jgi:hypothetical protein